MQSINYETYFALCKRLLIISQSLLRINNSSVGMWAERWGHVHTAGEVAAKVPAVVKIPPEQITD